MKAHDDIAGDKQSMLEACDKQQKEMALGIVLKNRLPLSEIQLVAGVDLAYWQEQDKDMAVCSIVVIDFKTQQVVEKESVVGEITFPYIAGYLAFRELPLVMETVKKLKQPPDVYVFDGNGYLHPRHMGIATYASFFLDKPTIGVAKSYYKVGETDFVMPENERGAFTDIIIDGEVYGRVLRTTKDVKPVFLSVGNYFDLDTAAKLAMQLVNKESRIPIPTRLADLETHVKRQEAASHWETKA